MVTAILPSLTNEEEEEEDERHLPAFARKRQNRNSQHSVTTSVESQSTITPERYTRTMSDDRIPVLVPPASSVDGAARSPNIKAKKSSALAGFVGLFTGCGALVALVLFLPLPAQFGEIEGVTPGQAVSYSFYIVGVVSLFVAVFVSVGLRHLKGEEGKGWKRLLGVRSQEDFDELVRTGSSREKVVPYLHLLRDSVFLGFTDSRIALGYVGGFVARASTVAISLFIPLFINTYFISHGFCQGSPDDPSPELKKECRSAYVLSSILTGVAQLLGLICAPLFGYLSGRGSTINYPIVISTTLGMIGYIIFPQLASPEIKNIDDRGGSPIIFLIVIFIGISQIGAIVCSLGSLSQGVLTVNQPSYVREPSIAPDEDESAEHEPLIRVATDENSDSCVRLKGSVAGVYSLCGGAAILILTKLGGYMFDKVSHGAPFYMMAAFNAVLLVVSLLIDASRTFAGTPER